MIPIHKSLDKYTETFIYKNVSAASNNTYTVPVILMVLIAAAWGGHSINSKAVSPDGDTVFYRIDASITKMQNQFWKLSQQFLRENKRKLKKVKCYVVVDETHDSYTGRLLKKASKLAEKLTRKDKTALKYIHKYQPEKGCTGSYKYLVIALVYGNRRRVLRVKALKKGEQYKGFIIKALLELRNEMLYECVLFDRGFYDGLFIQELERNKIPFIVRARISEFMKRVFGFYLEWKMYPDFEIGEHKVKGNLILGVDYAEDKRRKWAFITNMKFENWRKVREVYRKRWNIENVFKATDGIQLRVQTSSPVMRMFAVCWSFLLYNSWQSKNRKKSSRVPLATCVMSMLEVVFEFFVKTAGKSVDFFRTRLRIRLPFWDRIISSV